MTSDGIRYSNIEPDHEISAAPRADRRHRAAEPEPVPRRDVALGDGDEAGEPRLGGEQVVATARRACPSATAIADRQQLALRVEQEAEVHAPGERARLSLERLEPVLERCDRRRGRAPMSRRQLLDRCAARPRPRTSIVRAGGVVSLAMRARQSARSAARLGVPRELVRAAHRQAFAAASPRAALELGGCGQRPPRVRRPIGQGEQRPRARGQARRQRRAGDSAMRRQARPRHSAQALASAIRWPARLPLSTDETYRGSSGAQVVGVVPVVEVAAKALQPLHRRRASPRAARRVSSVPIQPKSRAATVDRR